MKFRSGFVSNSSSSSFVIQNHTKDEVENFLKNIDVYIPPYENKDFYKFDDNVKIEVINPNMSKEEKLEICRRIDSKTMYGFENDTEKLDERFCLDMYTKPVVMVYTTENYFNYEDVENIENEFNCDYVFLG